MLPFWSGYIFRPFEMCGGDGALVAFNLLSCLATMARATHSAPSNPSENSASEGKIRQNALTCYE